MSAGPTPQASGYGAPIDVETARRVAREALAEAVKRFKQPTKAFEDALQGGRLVLLGLPGLTPVEGGVPLLVAGKIVGAIGVGGVTSKQDGVCAQAGAAALGAGEKP